MPNAREGRQSGEVAQEAAGRRPGRGPDRVSRADRGQITELRKLLKSAVGEYKVVKNRLAKLAVRDGPGRLGAASQGPDGIAVSAHDPVAVAKALQTFGAADPASVKGGLVEGRVSWPRRWSTDRWPTLPRRAGAACARMASCVGARLQGPLSAGASALAARA